MDVTALLQSCHLIRGISEEDLTAMLGCLSAREISPRRGISSCARRRSIPSWGWCWRVRWR